MGQPRRNRTESPGPLENATAAPLIDLSEELSCLDAISGSDRVEVAQDEMVHIGVTGRLSAHRRQLAHPLGLSPAAPVKRRRQVNRVQAELLEQASRRCLDPDLQRVAQEDGRVLVVGRRDDRQAREHRLMAGIGRRLSEDHLITKLSCRPLHGDAVLSLLKGDQIGIDCRQHLGDLGPAATAAEQDVVSGDSYRRRPECLGRRAPPDRGRTHRPDSRRRAGPDRPESERCRV